MHIASEAAMHRIELVTCLIEFILKIVLYTALYMLTELLRRVLNIKSDYLIYLLYRKKNLTSGIHHMQNFYPRNFTLSDKSIKFKASNNLVLVVASNLSIVESTTSRT